MGMRTIPTEFYGDNTRWFMARVIDAAPPAGLEGRVRIRIFGIHSDNVNDIPQADLPWAQVMSPSHSYGVSGLGVNTMIQANALVFGVFLDGVNSQLPLVLGSLPQIEYPTTVQAADRDDLSTNPFAYDFFQSNSQVQDPKFYGRHNEGPESAANVARFFIDNGFNAKQACSITGTLQTISNLSPTFRGGIAGYPLDSPRYARFHAYCSRLKPQKDLDSFDSQLMFVVHELHTPHKTAFSKLHLAKEIEGNLYGENIDGVEKRGNGMVAALAKYFVHPETIFNQFAAESYALSVYSSLGAR